MEPDVRSPGESQFDPALLTRYRWALIGLGILGLAVLAYFLIQAFAEEKADARWDELTQIQERFEPELGQDPIFEDPAGVYTERRDRYAKALEAFLPRAEETDDALAPHVNYLLAKNYTDQFYASQDPVEGEARERYYRLAKKYWENLRDRYPDFQSNWLKFAPPGHGSATRMVLSVLEANYNWSKEQFPTEKQPAPDPVVVLRTERGDLRIGLYGEDAPELTKLFVERALRGDYDGTYFFARTDEGSDDDPVRRTIRGGHAGVREIANFDAAGATAFAEDANDVNLLPAASRYRIANAAGVVSTWHDPTDPYDGSSEFVVNVARSPQLDYSLSPFGRLLDEGSRATAKRIFEGETWGSRPSNDPPPDLARIRDFLRAPVRIVKALVYEKGTLAAYDATPSPTKAAADPGEDRLDALVPDAYRVKPVAAPDLSGEESADEGDPSGGADPDEPEPPQGD